MKFLLPDQTDSIVVHTVVLMPYLKTVIELRLGSVFSDIVLVYYSEADPDVEDVVTPGLERGWITECCITE